MCEDLRLKKNKKSVSVCQEILIELSLIADTMVANLKWVLFPSAWLATVEYCLYNEMDYRCSSERKLV